MGCQLTVGHDTTEGIFAICCGEFAGDSCDGMVRQSNLECIFYKRSRADTEFSCLVINNQSYVHIPCEMIKVDWSDKLTFRSFDSNNIIISLGKFSDIGI